ncbi:MAG: O-antigen ligase family protein [Terracidiphilus sp.]|nr:O-antigen ligase family protein [Terracidiphilus sp.]
MRRIAWWLLLLFAFAIPWEYSLDVGEPLGNIARILGLLLLLAAVPALLQAGRLRAPGAMQWLALALYLWFCCTYFWTIAPLATLEKMRGYFQEMMIVWLVWEFAESPRDLRALLRAYIAGSWVLAALTLANFGSAEAIAASQIRFAAEGQDPNDVARFLDLGLPLAALLVRCEPRWPARLLALGYLPLGLAAVVLTASRGGFLAAALALAGCALLLFRSRPRQALVGVLSLLVLAAALWFSVPHETLERLATIPSQLQGGDLNQRLQIWTAGWRAFAQSPVAGSGAGSFVSAARMNPLDTAHNSALSILVGGGLIALSLAVAIVVLAARAALKTRGPLKVALGTVLAVWAVASQVDTTEENRATWLLLGLIALAGRLAVEQPGELAECFDGGSQSGQESSQALLVLP